ncbi:Uncharacterised protein [uncultured archaeon]|nr:Uncharacterised protein [uncultured archaeon]
MIAMKILIGALIVLVALGGSAMAASSTTQVSATLSPYISLAVPSAISGWTLTQGDDNTISPGGLAVNSNAPWHIFVQSALDIPDKGNDYCGHFWSPTAYSAGLGVRVLGHGPGFLANPLVLNAGPGDVTLSDDSAPLVSGINLGSISIPLAMKQKVVMADPAANNYRIVIQFTASN